MWVWLRFLRRCEAENIADWNNIWVNRIDGLIRWYCRKFHHFKYDHVNIPYHGSALLVANHVSGLDPLLMVAACRRPLRFLIAREQYERFGLNWLFRAAGCIPVDRESSPLRAFHHALNALRHGEIIALFPHGAIHLDTDPPRRIKRGVIKLATLSESHIYPLRLEGIRGLRHTVLAVFIRSRARLHVFPVIKCKYPSEEAHCLKQLTEILEGRKKLCHMM
jgi:1-acyl-sn-glycerol-3-phosphate acyltransferase